MKNSIAPRHTGRGIVVHRGKILLMERWRSGMHYFSIPGGGVEDGETPEEAAIREVYEETTIKVIVERQVLTMRDGAVEHNIYLCTYRSGQPALRPDAPEFVGMSDNNRFKPGWVPVTELPQLPFLYWQPVQQPLIAGLQHEFPAEPVVVTANTQ